jgi:hypothetical protein
VSKLPVATHPMAAHVNPMLAVSESLSQGVHHIIFNTAELLREEGKRVGCASLPCGEMPTMTIADSAIWCRSSGLPRPEQS